jgi:hypothetical protein
VSVIGVDDTVDETIGVVVGVDVVAGSVDVVVLGVTKGIGGVALYKSVFLFSDSGFGVRKKNTPPQIKTTRMATNKTRFVFDIEKIIY